jgi:hypothetical protein
MSYKPFDIPLAEVETPLDPEAKKRIHDATRHCMESPPSGTPMLATEARVREIENSWRTTEATEERFFETHPELRWFQLLTPADDLLRRR